MSFKKFLNKFTLDYQDPSERHEYSETKDPFLKDFFQYCSLAIIAFLIPYTARFFDKNASPQKYIVVAILALAIGIFCIQRKIPKLSRYMEYFILAYVLAMIALVPTVARALLPVVSGREGFYMGFGYAMIHRLVGYQVVRFRYMVLIFVFSCCIKYPLIHNPDLILNFMVIVLEVATLVLSYRSEKMERGLFDSFYRSKKEIMKFKHLLTSYLPNQMIIFSNDYNQVQYMNNSFKRAFKSHSTATQVKESLGKYVVEKDTLEKHKSFFAKLGFLNQDENSTFSLSQFLSCLGQNMSILKENGMITFPVIENEKAQQEEQKDLMNLNEQNMQTEGYLLPKKEKEIQESLRVSNQLSDTARKELLLLPDVNDSYRSSDRGSSKSHSSDFVLEEGVKRVFKVKIFPLLWDDQEAIAMVLDDITQQKIIMELKVADQNKDLVIAMVSHELRTPLNGMLGLLDIARKHIDKTDALSYLNACRNSGLLMLNLVNSILDMNQIKNKKLRLVYTKINLKDVLIEIKALFDYFCLLKNLYLNIEIDPQVPKAIITDKNRLSQILVNLLGNAFKFTFSGGITIKVKLEEASPLKVRFIVQDTGIGIKKQDQDRLFKMYGRLEQEDNKVNTNGIGLGLTISNSLAMLLNPIDQKPIQVESEVNKGTCFSFSVQSQIIEGDSAHLTLADISSNILNEDRDATVLKKMTFYANLESEGKSISQTVGPKPAVYSGKKSKLSVVSVNCPPDSATNLNFDDNSNNSFSNLFRSNVGSKENDKTKQQGLLNQQKTLAFPEIPEENAQEYDKPWCLVVDDNPFNLMVACHIMEERNYQVETGLNGQEAILRVKEHQAKGQTFTVILMDCQMPVMDGYEATRVLRGMMKNGECGECPIIALTANSRDERHDKRCEEVGMSGHISKPLQIDELETVLKEVSK